MSQSITAASNANPAVLTSTAHGLATGGRVTISGATGAWAALNGSWDVTKLTNDTFAVAVDSTLFGALAGIPVFGAPSLISLQQVKSFLEIASSQYDAKIQDRIDAAVDLAGDYCDRVFAQASYDPATDPDNALLDGNDIPAIWTPQWPILSVTSLTLVQEGNNGDLVSYAANQYAVHRNEGKITLLGGEIFPRGAQNVAIVYSAGFAVAPKRLQEALILSAAKLHLLGNTRRLGAKSIATTGGAGGGQTTYCIDDIPIEARAILDRFRSVIPR